VPPAFPAVPDWFPWANQGADSAVADLTGNGRPDLLVLMVDDGPQQNRGVYRVGHDLDPAGVVTGGWAPWLDVPDWFPWANQGAGVALADVTGNGRPDLIVLMVDDGAQQNRGLYRVGRDVDADGAVTSGWTPWTDVPDWFPWRNQGAGVAVADVTGLRGPNAPAGSGRPDVIVFMVDDGDEVNRGLYRIGRDLDADGVVTGGWTPWIDVPDWFSWENQGGGIAVGDVTGSGRPDLVVVGVDNPPARNQAFYRIGADLGADGAAARWSTPLGIPNWYSWENQGAGVAVADLGAGPVAVVVAVDAPPGANNAFTVTIPLREDPAVHGTWTVLPYDSQVLAIHAALLRTGHVLFFAGSGNNTVRDADPFFGDAARDLGTSVVWDPASPNGGFTHPTTLDRADGRPFDYFCCGHAPLADGRILAGGGNLAYNHGNNLGQRDCSSFDPVTGQWSTRPPTAIGRWYPTLLALADGRVLAVSGKNDTNGDLNAQIEVYDPLLDKWAPRHPPQGLGLPFYAHLFLLADGRVFFSGGRMDDGRYQPAGILDLDQDPIGFQPVPAILDGFTRNQSSSVLLPPAQRQEVMILGGGPGMEMANATGHTETVALNGPAPGYVESAPLSLPRIHQNAVVLPDRTVFVSGGAMTHEGGMMNMGGGMMMPAMPVPRLQSEIYDPAAGTWQAGAVATVVRLYHSVALLLPDGSVMTACGNPPPYGNRAPWHPPQANEELRIEIYRPPYLFRGPRPAITGLRGPNAQPGAPYEWGYGETVTVQSPQAGGLRWAQLIAPGSTTHAYDCHQRLVDLPITAQGGGQVQVRTPDTAGLAPPGWYMLTVVDQDRVPSEAHWVHLT
jgi:hypothetical protein